MINDASFPVTHQGSVAAYRNFINSLANIMANRPQTDRPADMDVDTVTTHYRKQLLTATCVDWLNGMDMVLLRETMAQFLRTTRGLDLQDRYGVHFPTLVAAKTARLMWLVRTHAMREGYACVRGLTSLEKQLSEVRTPALLKDVFTKWFHEDFLSHLYVCCRNFGRLTVRSTGSIDKLLREAALQAAHNQVIPTDTVNVHSSAARGDLAGVVHGVVSCGRDVDAPLSRKLPVTALMLAATNGHVDTMETLLKLGADVSAKIFIIGYACMCVHVNADTNMRTNSYARIFT